MAGMPVYLLADNLGGQLGLYCVLCTVTSIPFPTQMIDTGCMLETTYIPPWAFFATYPRDTVS